jgi:hypothetical protein
MGALLSLKLCGPSALVAAVCLAQSGRIEPSEIARQLVGQESGSSGYEREQEARSQLIKAEQQTAKGLYAEARRIYKTIVQRFPGTLAATIAGRRSRPSAFLGWSDIVRHGPSANRVDVVLMGDGYQLDDMKGFARFADDVPNYFEQQRTLGEYYSYFNFLRADLLSAEDGWDGYGREYDTALNAKLIDTYAEGRTLGANTNIDVDVALVRAMLGELPEHDGLAVAFVKGASGGSAGSGYACLGGLEEKKLIHCFGHAFADLADESAGLSHEPGAAKDHVNVSISEDAERLPWRHWIKAKVPGVGTYEGAAGFQRGVWKPNASNCVMEGLGGEHFYCLVCQEAVVLRIYALVDPIESARPEMKPGVAAVPIVLGEEPTQFEVRVMMPRTHELEVHWWMLSEARAAPAAGESAARPFAANFGDRRDRGSLEAITEKPRAITSGDKNGVHSLSLRASDLGAGVYRIVCRVKDTTRLPKERWPLVMKDEFGVLESERAWLVHR